MENNWCDVALKVFGTTCIYCAEARTKAYIKEKALFCGKIMVSRSDGGHYGCTREWGHDGSCVACGIDEHMF